MRHTPSAWVRSDTHPYDGMTMDPNGMTAGYGPTSSVYDRARPFDARSDPRHYYSDRRDSGYTSGYDVPRDSLYAAPSYMSMGVSSDGQPDMYPMREHRELLPHFRTDSMAYGGTR